MPDESVCIVDFCGTYNHTRKCSFWANWWIAAKVVTFGGEWGEVPDMPSGTEPTPKAVNKWAHTHGGI